MHLPNHLVLARRSVDHEIGSGEPDARLNGLEGAVAILVQVEVHMANGLHILFPAMRRIAIQSVLGDIDIVTIRVGVAKPRLPFGRSDRLGSVDSLDGIALRAVVDQHREMVLRLVVRFDVFLGRQTTALGRVLCLMPACLLLAKVKRGEVVAIRLRVVTLDFEDLRYQTLAGTAFQLDDDV